VDLCEQLLEGMDENFAPPDEHLIWPRENVQVEGLRSLLRAIAGGQSLARAALKLDDGSVIQTNGDNFVPHLRQKLVLRGKDSKLVGAELWLRADSL